MVPYEIFMNLRLRPKNLISVSSSEIHCVKYRNFTCFPGVVILWKHFVSTGFRAIRPKLCGSCAFPKNLSTRKIGEITVFHAVIFH